LADARGDIGGSIAMLRSFVALVTELEQNEDRSGLPGTGQASFVRIRHVPVGPVGVIGPWNTPVFLAFNGIAPALASGCTVVVKPPAEAPLGLTATVRILAAHLPAGVLNVVPGRGSVIGSALAAHPGIRAVMFTGGTQAGRSVAVAGASNVKKVALEIGGNDAAIVLADARIDDDLITEMAAGCFSVSGQVCFKIKRIYVHRSRHDEFIEKFSAAVSRIVVGDPFDPTVHMGPLTTRDGYENALRLPEAARAAGADVVPLGIRAASADWDSDTYIAPTLVTGLPYDHELVLDEQFAPIIPGVPFDTDDEAIYEANRTEFGLSSSVWSADVTHAEEVARRIEAGNTYINVHRLGASVPLAPFGGVKQSGSGRTHGLHSLHHCTEEHAIIAFDDPSTKLPGIAGWQTIVGKERREHDHRDVGFPRPRDAPVPAHRYRRGLGAAELFDEYRTLLASKAVDPGFESLMGYFLRSNHPQPRSVIDKLADLGPQRIADMDATGIDRQILGLTAPGTQVLDKDTAHRIAQLSNDRLAEAVAAHPDRYSGLAAVGFEDADRAVAELDRTVGSLGLKGLIANSHIKGAYLVDEPQFRQILEKLADLDVPLYLHPQTLPADAIRPYQEAGLDGAVWGFGAETGLHLLRLITSGTFDRIPNLRVVVGHLGEGLPYRMHRIDHMHAKQVAAGRYEAIKPLQQRPSEYLKTHIWADHKRYAVGARDHFRSPRRRGRLRHVRNGLPVPVRRPRGGRHGCAPLPAGRATRFLPGNRGARLRAVALGRDGRGPRPSSVVGTTGTGS
jgi:acyl-CoA reductase-like NAD-dependent aldehyde dehydrogenase/predicted TIM-barrel fold metal-dependent hydrolase